MSSGPVDFLQERQFEIMKEKKRKLNDLKKFNRKITKEQLISGQFTSDVLNEPDLNNRIAECFDYRSQKMKAKTNF